MAIEFISSFRRREDFPGGGRGVGAPDATTENRQLAVACSPRTSKASVLSRW